MVGFGKNNGHYVSCVLFDVEKNRTLNMISSENHAKSSKLLAHFLVGPKSKRQTLIVFL